MFYTIEFMHEDEIFKEFGDEDITRYRLSRGKARISDDTQMTLFTANGMLFGQTRGMMRGIGGVHRDYIRMAYLDWLDTQTQTYPYKSDHLRISWLANFEEFYHLRAPGTTCMSALRQGGFGSIQKPINGSKGWGGVMRVAPIGLYLCNNEDFTSEDIDMLGAEAAAITHGQELGYIPAAALVHSIQAIASGKHTDLASAVTKSVQAMQTLFPDTKRKASLCFQILSDIAYR